MSQPEGSTIADWLAQAGLSKYAALFAENGIEFDILADLTEADLAGIGVVLGDRKRLLRAIAALSPAAAAPAEPPPAPVAAVPVPAVPGPAPPATPHPQESWRRHLTVLFCDLVGSTPMSHRMDPEDFSQIIRSFQDACTGTITRGAGYIARFMGDGILAYFGYPQAHEDDAQSAARVGLELVTKVGQLRTPDGEPLRVRVGIATGLVVVVGEAIGTGMAQEQSVVGETPNLAARLQSLAEPGTVLVADSTHQLLGDMFTYEDMALHTVKGLDEPVHVWKVLREQKNESRFDATRSRNLTELIGRTPELRRLSEFWQSARAGHGRIALVSGEAGIGKSRVCRALLDMAADEPHYGMRYQCSPHHLQSPLYPIIGQLEHAANFERDDSADMKLDKLTRLLDEAGINTPDDTALFAALLSIPAEHRYPLPEISPARQRERTIDALVRHLFALASRRPVLLVMEDLHWIDPTTLEVVNRCLARAQSAPILMVLTFRPEFFPPWLDQPHVSMFQLNRLGHEEVVAMIERVTGGRSLPPDVYQQIVSRTDGVPLFVEELTKTVLESGILREAGDHYELVGPLPPLAIPATLQETLMARLDRLASIREVAQVASALGREFSFRLLSGVTQMPRTELATALAQLSGADMIHGRGDPPDSHYIFKHALVQGAAYETLLRTRRRQLHARIAEVLVKEFSSTAETQPELIAHHLSQAGLEESAIQYLRRAAQRSIQRSANSEAISHLKQAQELLNAVPETPERQQALLDVDIALGQAMIAGIGYAAPETRQVLLRAKSNITDTTEPEKKLAILYGLWSGYYVGSDLPMQREIGEAFLAEADRIGDVAAQCIANRMLGATLVMLGEFQAGRVRLETAFALYDPAEHPRYRFQYGQDIGATALCYLTWALWHLGEYDRALATSKQAMELAKSLSHPHTIAYTMCHALGLIDTFRVRPAATHGYAYDIIHLCEEHGFPFWAAGGRILAGWANTHVGDSRRGLEQFHAGLSAWRGSGALIWVPYYLALEADAQIRLGRPELALRKINEAIAMAGQTGERWSSAELLRIKAGILLSSDPPNVAEAEALLVDGLEIAGEQDARYWQARIAGDLACLLRRSGRDEPAQELLSRYGDGQLEMLAGQ